MAAFQEPSKFLEGYRMTCIWIRDAINSWALKLSSGLYFALGLHVARIMYVAAGAGLFHQVQA